MKGFMTSPVVRALARRGRLARVLAAVAMGGLLMSACDVHGVSAPGSLTAIVVTPNPQVLAVGGTQQFTAIGRDFSGANVPISPTWSVVAGGGAISTSGVFTAAALAGTYSNTVQASANGVSATATVVVTPGPLATIVVTPTPVVMGSGTTQQFVAVGKDAAGNIVQFTPTWSVVAGGGAIDGNGIFTAGRTAGTYTNTVQASNRGITGLATVTVVPGPLASIALTPNPVTMNVGVTQQFTAVGQDATGNPVPATFTWSLMAGGGTLNNAGLFTAGSTPGTYTNTVKVTSGAISATATVTVTAGPLATITVTPTPATMAIAGTQQFTAVGKDIGGNVLAIAPTWTIVAGGGAVSSTGMFTAGNLTGTYTNTVRASSGAISGYATVIVTSGPLASITVTPNPVSLLSGATQTFIAVGKDASNNVFLITPQWTVVNNGGTIDLTTGVFTAGATAGTYTNTVKATSGAISGTATVTVTALIPPPPPSPLGTAANFGILAGQGITCAISGTIGGSASNIGSSPLAVYTGFVPNPPGPCTYTGTIPLPAVVATAKGDLTVAYLAAQAKVCDVNLTGFDLGFYDGSTPTKTLAGNKVYCFSTSAGITGTLKLTGSAAQTWTFQIGSTLTENVGSSVVLAGGAIPDNVYWAVGTSATIGTSATLQGNVMAQTSITLNNGATLLGRALAQVGAVDMTAGGATIIKP